jgi:phenylacetic acid degradation protein paaN
MELFKKHQPIINAAIKAISERIYYTPYPELPKFYAEDGDAKAKIYISSIMNTDYNELLQEKSGQHIGEEISPFLQVGLGVKYPKYEVKNLVSNADAAQKSWYKLSIEERTGILIETLERIKERFFDITYATMHTTGQSYMMSFQASGPHSNDRALEAIIQGYIELTKYVKEVDWVKPMGKFDLKVHKTFKAMPKGVGLVIGCSTFPIWNSVPGLYADLITGNAVIVKPHPKAVLPIAIVVAEIQKVFKENGVDVNTVQLAADSLSSPITKQLAEHSSVKLIDYTGGSEFGNYIETLPKVTFTEKAGVNSVIIDSAADLKAVMQNLAFSASLYSGQMCTAPQNIFISKGGVKTNEGIVSFDDAVKLLADCITGLVDNPKAGASTLGAIQSDVTYKRVADSKSLGGKVILESKSIKNEEFADARIATPTVIEFDRNQDNVYSHECFGPVLFVIKTNDTNDSIELTKKLIMDKGAITCAAYSTDDDVVNKIADEMNEVFTPVSFNFTGAAFINSHAAFSDFHVTGGNAAGNASFVNAEYIVKRFVWVGNRYA